MGYPMSYRRVLGRGGLLGGYDDEGAPRAVAPIAGDLRRWEHDVRDDHNVVRLADLAGVTPAQVRAILDDVLQGAPGRSPWLSLPYGFCDATACRERQESQR